MWAPSTKTGLVNWLVKRYPQTPRSKFTKDSKERLYAMYYSTRRMSLDKTKTLFNSKTIQEGDRVIFLHIPTSPNYNMQLVGKVGYVVHIKHDDAVGVEFEGWGGGHNIDGQIDGQDGWFCSKDNLRKL